MIKPGPVLLIGGPMDGQVMQVSNPAEPLVAMRCNPTYLHNLGVPDATSVPAAFSQGLYRPRDISIFSLVLRVHVWDDEAEERVEASLARHLLSDAARAVEHQSTIFPV